MSSSCAIETSNRDDYVDDYPPARGPGVVPSGSGDVEFGVEWTIDGSDAPGVCRSFDVDYAHVEIADDIGVVDEADVDCEEFAYDAPLLPPGSYWATVVLRDAGDRDLTTPARTDARDLFPGESDYVAVDFPEESFR
jgi:hypothetical protein